MSKVNVMCKLTSASTFCSAQSDNLVVVAKQVIRQIARDRITKFIKIVVSKIPLPRFKSDAQFTQLKVFQYL